MTAVFTPGAIGSLQLANRIIRTASHEGLADDRGRPTNEQFQFYRGFVEGGIGLVITGYAGISRAGKSALYRMTMVERTGCCDAIELSCGANEDGFVMARGGFPTGAILKYLRPYRTYHPGVKLLMRCLVIPFLKLRQPAFQEGYNLETAARVKRAVSLPVITVGGMRSRHFMDQAIEKNMTDFVSLARPLLLEPDLPNKFQAGVSDMALCDNCNQCVVAADAVSIRCHNDNLLDRNKAGFS